VSRRRFLVCPDWCNARHAADSAPGRQKHRSSWQTRWNSNLTRVELYPCAGNEVSTSGAFVYVGEGAWGSREGVHAYIDARDLRSLAERLLEIADAADMETKVAAEDLQNA
jgi:hypothetical protein